MTSVVVVDDQDLVRAGFCALLEDAEGIDLLGQAADGRAAIDVVTATAPDVVLMDIRMPVLDGIAATRSVLTLPDPPRVLILTTFDSDDNVFAALEAGAAGFLVKDTPPAQLVTAVRAAAEGGSVISPGTTRRLIDRIVATRPSSEDPSPPALESLTGREREVLRLVAVGLSNRELAARLVISELTAKTHVSRVLTKLGLTSRVQLAVLAYETGIVTPGGTSDGVPRTHPLPDDPRDGRS